MKVKVSEQMYYDTSKNDHGLPYNPFKALTVPRPIGWISTVSKNGIGNLSPYSYFNGLSYDPPFVMFSAGNRADGSKKDSVLNVGSFYVPIFMDDENYFLEIKYLKNEIINTKWGKVDCMVFQPKMQEGRIFEDGEEMKIWISDDKNHLLLRVETKIWTGLIKAVLQEYKHVKYPLSIIEE